MMCKARMRRKKKIIQSRILQDEEERESLDAHAKRWKSEFLDNALKRTAQHSGKKEKKESEEQLWTRTN
jgi:hypothetical protein